MNKVEDSFSPSPTSSLHASDFKAMRATCTSSVNSKDWAVISLEALIPINSYIAYEKIGN